MKVHIALFKKLCVKLKVPQSGSNPGLQITYVISIHKAEVVSVVFLIKASANKRKHAGSVLFPL